MERGKGECSLFPQTAPEGHPTELMRTESEWRIKVADTPSQGAFRLNSPIPPVRAPQNSVLQNGAEDAPAERPNRQLGEGVAVDTSSSSLLAAVWEGNVLRLQEILTKGADPNERDPAVERPAVSLAAQWEGIGVQMMQLLHTHGADISAVDLRGCTALNIAAEAGIPENVEWLVSKGGNVNWKNSKRQTPLYAAASRNRVGIVHALLKSGAFVNSETSEGATPVFIAAQNGYVNVIKMLHKYNADLGYPKEGGATPLFIASQMGHYQVVKFLLKKLRKSCPADIDRPTDKGLTALMVAAQLGYAEIVRLLLKSGCDWDKSWRGKNALALARDKQQQEVIKVFTVEPRDGWDPDELADKCTACSAPFTIRRRRHHCRACKHIFCSACTPHRTEVPSLRWLGALRVCVTCFSSLSSTAGAT